MRGDVSSALARNAHGSQTHDSPSYSRSGAECCVAMSTSSLLKIGRTTGGYLIGVEGQGTLLVEGCLGDEDLSVAVDLSACEYLDSTFLGCLVTLHLKYGCPSHTRFHIVASPEARRNLLHRSRLDSLFQPGTRPPETVGEPVEVEVASPDWRQLGRHIAEAHRCLAELGGSEAVRFSRVAQRIEDELAND